MKINEILSGLDKMIENPRCELDYKKDYELLIATVLSAQCTDARVNKVTKVLWSKYDLKSLSNAKKSDIEKIIYSCGNYKKKSEYIINIAKNLLKDRPIERVSPVSFNTSFLILKQVSTCFPLVLDKSK